MKDGLKQSPTEALGGNVLTTVHGDDHATVTVSGTGLAGTEIGAETMLRMWLEQLDEVCEAKIRRNQGGCTALSG